MRGGEMSGNITIEERMQKWLRVKKILRGERCKNCAFHKVEHFLDRNLLHHAVHVCKIKGKTVAPTDGKCNTFIHENSPFLKETGGQK